MNDIKYIKFIPIKMSKQWKDLFNQKSVLKESDHDIISNHLKSINSSIYIKETIPQSIIKKSKKDAYKKV